MMTRLRSDRGAAAVEFALVLPVLLAVVFGIIEFGWAFGQQVSLGNAARETARTMAIHWAESGAATEAINEGKDAAPLIKDDVVITFTSMECAPTNPSDEPLSVTARATIDAPGLTGWFDFLWPGGMLSAESKMICGG